MPQSHGSYIKWNLEGKTQMAFATARMHRKGRKGNSNHHEHLLTQDMMTDLYILQEPCVESMLFSKFSVEAVSAVPLVVRLPSFSRPFSVVPLG
jgi:hypothetical protein